MDGIQIRNVRTLDDSQSSDDLSLGSDCDSIDSALIIDEGPELPLPISPEKTSRKRDFPKPPLSYSTLAGLAFKNCLYGNVPVGAVYSFIVRHFPYYRNAPAGWKNSIRHNLSMNKSFMRLAPDYEVESLKSKKGLMWTVHPEQIPRIEEAIKRAVQSNRPGVLAAMRYPEDLEIILLGRQNDGKAKYYDSFDEESDEEKTVSLESQAEKTFIFTQFKDGVLPLVTLYSKTPALHSKYSAKYPVVT